jgi:hypothetical protein
MHYAKLYTTIVLSVLKGDGLRMTICKIILCKMIKIYKLTLETNQKIMMKEAKKTLKQQIAVTSNLVANN